MSLNRDDPLPLHLQLKGLLATDIAHGVIGPGERFPSERQLQKTYDVSRATVREALRELAQEGLVSVISGRGAFVAIPPQHLTVDVSLAGFTTDLQRAGLMPASTLLAAHLTTEVPAEVRQALGLAEGAEIVYLERVRLATRAGRQMPLALHKSYLNHRLCPQILQFNLAQESVTRLLREHYGLQLKSAEEVICASLAEPRELELLKLHHPAPVLRCRRTTLLASGEVIEYSLATDCGDWYRLRIALNPNLDDAEWSANG